MDRDKYNNSLLLYGFSPSLITVLYITHMYNICKYNNLKKKSSKSINFKHEL